MTPNDHHIRKLRQAVAYKRLYEDRRPHQHLGGRLDLHDFAAEYVGKTQPVSYLEFGVFDGKSFFRWAANLTNPATRLTGFDSFQGLPESWDVGFKVFERGTFSTSGQAPTAEDPRINFVKGWFQNTLPGFFKHLDRAFSPKIVVHFDADLYSSTLFLLSSLWHYIPEYYFIMDDFLQDDVIALHDFTMAFPIELEWIADHAAPSGLPLQVFGKIKRIELVLDSPRSS